VTTPVPRCVICEQEVRELGRSLYTGRPLAGERLVRCTACGSVQIDPMPSAAALASLYTGDYFAEFASGRGMAGGAYEVRPYLKQRLMALAAKYGRGRLLDLGCGSGLFVAHAKSEGWDAIGVEPSAWAAEDGRRRFGIEIYNGTLEEAPLSPESFDVIHANHVVEHVTDPIGTMRTAAKLLRPGGTFVAEVPQELDKPLGEAVIGAIRGEQPEPTGPHHVVFFSRKGLRAASERAGFRVDRIDNTRHLDNLRPRALPFRVRRSLFFALESAIGRAPVFVLWASRPGERTR
jgi:2-polyprenyl-3-methyl-5-hydroxy-6-metoxy-1,4-benzoquinol methylase